MATALLIGFLIVLGLLLWAVIVCLVMDS